MKLTDLARGQPCSVRLPGCDGGGQTTVAAHFRSLRLGAGMGIKPESLFIAFACASCHDAVDGRRKVEGMTRDYIRHTHVLGVLETQDWLLRNGHISIGKSDGR